MFQNRTFSFVGHFKLFLVISALLVVTGVVGLVTLPFGLNLFNMDVDFLGGVTMTYDLGTQVDTGEVETLAKEVLEGKLSSVTTSGSTGTQVVIKSLFVPVETRDELTTTIQETYEGATVVSSSSVSASVSEDLRNSALISALVAVLCMLVYIGIRFDFRSGLAAVVALCHDLLVMLSAYIIFRIPFNINFIAAALTILGYSINATIVVFDRARENAKANPRANFGDVMDASIWQTMTRSINTTITTLLTITMVIILGVTSIRNFCWPLFVGVLAGCYSSVCISGNVWVRLRRLGKHTEEETK
jgi:preprotein translocase SecF subunit